MVDFKDVMAEMYKETVRENQDKEQAQISYDTIYGALGDRMSCSEIQAVFKSGGVIIDVRNPVDYISGGRVFNAVNVPASKVVKWCIENDEVGLNTPILLYSDDGQLSQSAKDDLELYHYKNVTNIGTHKWYPECS